MDTSDVHRRLLPVSLAVDNEDIEDNHDLIRISHLLQMNPPQHRSMEYPRCFSHHQKSTVTVLQNLTCHLPEKYPNARQFPADVQDLAISITSHHQIENCILVQDNHFRSFINREAFVDQQEWSLYEHVATEERKTKEEYSFDDDHTGVEQKNHSVLAVTCRAARRSGYYYWNGFGLIFLITICSFCVFSISPNLPQNRLQITCTLVLTSITFRWVVNRSLYLYGDPCRRQREMEYLDREYDAKKHIQLYTSPLQYGSKQELGFRHSSSVFEHLLTMKSMHNLSREAMNMIEVREQDGSDDDEEKSNHVTCIEPC